MIIRGDEEKEAGHIGEYRSEQQKENPPVFLIGEKRGEGGVGDEIGHKLIQNDRSHPEAALAAEGSPRWTEFYLERLRSFSKNSNFLQSNRYFLKSK